MLVATSSTPYYEATYGLACTLALPAPDAAAIVFGVVCLFVVYWGVLVRRSLKDHVELPYHRYK